MNSMHKNRFDASNPNKQMSSNTEVASKDCLHGWVFYNPIFEDIQAEAGDIAVDDVMGVDGVMVEDDDNQESEFIGIPWI